MGVGSFRSSAWIQIRSLIIRQRLHSILVETSLWNGYLFITKPNIRPDEQTPELPTDHPSQPIPTRYFQHITSFASYDSVATYPAATLALSILATVAGIFFFSFTSVST